VHERN
jgi:chromosome segregation ATPase